FLRLPTPRLPGDDGRPGFAFSFSGIKTAVLYTLRALPEPERRRVLEGHVADVCASLERAVVAALVGALRDPVRAGGVRDVAGAGGGAASGARRGAAQAAAEEDGVRLYAPALRDAVDDAAVLAVTGAFKLAAGLTSPLSLSAEPALRL